jgi:Family of unknown function (DUF5312)
MEGSLNTFERLVLTLGSSERQEMLRQFAETGELKEDQSSPVEARPDGASVGARFAEKQLRSEPLLVRLWFSLVAFLSSSSPARSYSRYLVAQLGAEVTRSAGSYVNVPHRTYTESLHHEFLKLKRAQDFFSGLLSAYEADKGGFYLVIGSLLIKETDKAIAAAADPFARDFREDPKKDLRMALLREMEGLISSMPDSERGKMYQAAGAVEWIRSYCALPIDKIIQRFGIIPGSTQTCLMDTVTDEMRMLVDCFAGAKRIPVLLLEAMYLFSVQARLGEEKFSIERECRTFVDSAAASLSDIRQIKESIPLADFVRLSMSDVQWQPEPRSEGEDWFVLYRAAWKSRFEEKWAEWNRLHRKSMLERDICVYLSAGELPSLAYHPWEGAWLPLFMRREISLCFLKGLFGTVYPSRWVKPLKILLIDGDFYRRENLIEYTDAFSALEHIGRSIEQFETRCSPKGNIGEGFALVQNDKIATIAGKTRLENLMLTVNSEVEQIISLSLAAFRSVDSILSGIIDAKRGGPYETLLNLSTIQGNKNETFRKELAAVLQMVRTACAILSESEVLEREFA